MMGNGSWPVKESSLFRITRRPALGGVTASREEGRVVRHDASGSESSVSGQLTPVAVRQEGVLDAEIELATTPVIVSFSNS